MYKNGRSQLGGSDIRNMLVLTALLWALPVIVALPQAALPSASDSVSASSSVSDASPSSFDSSAAPSSSAVSSAVESSISSFDESPSSSVQPSSIQPSSAQPSAISSSSEAVFSSSSVASAQGVTASSTPQSNLTLSAYCNPDTLISRYRFPSGIFQSDPPAFTCGCSGTPVDGGGFTVCNSDLSDNRIQCDSSCADCGPYTLPRFDRRFPPDSCFDYAALGCPGQAPICSTPGELPAAGKPSEDHPSPADPELNDDQLALYKAMELELFAESLKNGDGGNQPIDLPYCGLSDTPSVNKRALLWGGLFKSIKLPKLQCIEPRIDIPIYWNVITTNCTTASLMTPDVLSRTVAEIKAAYDPYRIYFYEPQDNVRYFQPVGEPNSEIRRFAQNQRRTQDDLDFNNQFINRRQALNERKDILNLFVVETINDGGVNGYCGFPEGNTFGCVVTMDTLTGVSFADADRDGKPTAIHEIGHWFGLKHTHDETAEQQLCSGTDDLSSTPQTGYQNRFCPQQYQCIQPGEEAKQPRTINNFMSYAPVRNQFTQQQAARMITNFWQLRRGSKDVPVCKFTLGRRSTHERLQAKRITKRGRLSTRRNIVEELKSVCATPYDPNEVLTGVENPDQEITDVPGGSAELPPGPDVIPPSQPPSQPPVQPPSQPPIQPPSQPPVQPPSQPPSAPSVGPTPPPAGQGVEIHPNGNRAKCLDLEGNLRYNGGRVQLYDCNGTGAQKWIINNANTKVRLAGTDYCLDAGSNPASGIGMKIWQCYDNLPAQAFYFTDDRRIAVTGKGQCLDLTDGDLGRGRVQTWLCTDFNTNQIWTL